MSLVRFRLWALSDIKRQKTEYGALAQSVEHLTFNQVVRGSNPDASLRTITLVVVFFIISQKKDTFCKEIGQNETK